MTDFRATLGLTPLEPIPMRFRCRILVAAVVLTCGCGNHAVPYESAASGNWAIYSTGGTAAPVIGGSLAFSGSSATANFYMPGSSCFPAGNLQLTGTTDHAGNLTLTSTSVNGQVITLAGAVAGTNSSIPDGQFRVSGGCADGQTGAFEAELIPSLTGGWTGNATFQDGTGNSNFTTAVTLEIQQAPSATAFWFPVTGTLDLAQGPCSLGNGDLIENVLLESNGIYESSTAGYELWAGALMQNGEITLAGSIPSSNLNMAQATLTVTGGTCAGYTASNVTLTRQ
jgi:hypothetical protein